LVFFSFSAPSTGVGIAAGRELKILSSEEMDGIFNG
jgi:hypothetical protein